jgi:starch phosphorylase
MRESMARLTPRYCAERAVREYTENHYLSGAKTYLARSADKGVVGSQIVDWKLSLEQKWATLRFGDLKVETKDGQHIFEVQIYLNELEPKAVQVEVYANGLNGEPPVRQEMKCVRPLVGAAGGYAFRAAVLATRPPSDYTTRVIPYFDGVAVPLEAAQILWQR